jgi:hypothetical protein
MQTISLGREPIEDEVNQELESAKEIEVEKKKNRKRKSCLDSQESDSSDG